MADFVLSPAYMSSTSTRAPGRRDDNAISNSGPFGAAAGLVNVPGPNSTKRTQESLEPRVLRCEVRGNTRKHAPTGAITFASSLTG